MVRHANRRSICTARGALGENDPTPRANGPRAPLARSFDPFSRSKRDGLNNAQTSELGRLSTGKGGLPLMRPLISPERDNEPNPKLLGLGIPLIRCDQAILLAVLEA